MGGSEAWRRKLECGVGVQSEIEESEPEQQRKMELENMVMFCLRCICVNYYIGGKGMVNLVLQFEQQYYTFVWKVVFGYRSKALVSKPEL